MAANVTGYDDEDFCVRLLHQTTSFTSALAFVLLYVRTCPSIVRCEYTYCKKKVVWVCPTFRSIAPVDYVTMVISKA